MKKIQTLSSLSKLLNQSTHHKNKIGLVTGCFDILHAGHVDLIRFAKKHCDILIVGLENDDTIKLSKGTGRPIHTFQQRSTLMSELQSVDYVFKIPIVTKFGNSKDIQDKYVKMTMKIKPDYIFTTHVADKYLDNKHQGAKVLNSKLLVYHPRTSTSTTAIAKKLSVEV